MPTIDELGNQIEIDTRAELLKNAYKTIELLAPKYKHLSELINSEADCEKIFYFITKGYGDCKISSIEYREDCIHIQSEGSLDDGSSFYRGVFICFSGFIEHYINHISIDESGLDYDTNRNEEPIENIFELVDFVRGLGYSI